MCNSGGIEDTKFEAMAKDLKNIRGQGQEPIFQGQTLSRRRTGLVEAKTKDQGRNSLKLWLTNFRLFLSAKVFQIFDDISLSF